MGEQLLTIKEFSERAGISCKSVRRLLEDNEIRQAYSLSSKVMIPVGELSKILNGGKNAG